MKLHAVRAVVLIAVALASTGAIATAARSSSPPVGKLPAGRTSTITTVRGELIAIALPRRSAGRVWRIARPFDGKIVREVAEQDVGASVVVVFRATATGRTSVIFALTRGETATAFDARTFKIQVR